LNAIESGHMLNFRPVCPKAGKHRLVDGTAA
jgi:hypothetical protein